MENTTILTRDLRERYLQCRASSGGLANSLQKVARLRSPLRIQTAARAETYYPSIPVL